MPETEIPNGSTAPPQSTHTTTYHLTLFECDDVGEEDIEMTRAEYIALKRHLAAMRGYRRPTGDEAVRQICACEGLKDYTASDEQQMAAHLETARDFYRCVPDLVVFESVEFDRELAEIGEAGGV